MSLFSPAADEPSRAACALEARLRECDALIDSRNTALRHFEESAAKTRAEIAQATEMRSGMAAALETLLTAETLMQQQLAAYDAWAHPPRLRVVGDTASAQEAQSETAPEEEAPEEEDEVPFPDAPTIAISKVRAAPIMEVVSTEPKRKWSVAAVASALAESDPAGEKRVRSGLEELHKKGVLAKRPADRDSPVTFRQIAHWRPLP